VSAPNGEHQNSRRDPSGRLRKFGAPSRGGRLPPAPPVPGAPKGAAGGHTFLPHLRQEGEGARAAWEQEGGKARGAERERRICSRRSSRRGSRRGRWRTPSLLPSAQHATADLSSDVTPTSSLGFNFLFRTSLPLRWTGSWKLPTHEEEASWEATPYPTTPLTASRAGAPKAGGGSSQAGGSSLQGRLESTSMRSTETQAVSVGSQSGSYGSFGDLSLHSNPAVPTTPRGKQRP